MHRADPQGSRAPPPATRAVRASRRLRAARRETRGPNLFVEAAPRGRPYGEAACFYRSLRPPRLRGMIGEVYERNLSRDIHLMMSAGVPVPITHDRTIGET